MGQAKAILKGRDGLETCLVQWLWIPDVDVLAVTSESNFRDENDREVYFCPLIRSLKRIGKMTCELSMQGECRSEF